MASITYRDPRTGREQTFDDSETNRRRILEQAGWRRRRDEPAPTEQPDKPAKKGRVKAEPAPAVEPDGE